jgi:hypothetical protein
MTEVDTALSFEIPSMLLGVWDNPSCGRYEPIFRQNVKIIEGVLKYEIPEEWFLVADREVKTDA